MNQQHALFRLENLWYSYQPGGTRQLDIPFLELREHECVALLGPNGSGKTTILKLLNYLLPCQGTPQHSGGTLLFRGQPYIRRVARSCSVYLHQHPWMLRGTVAENLAAARGHTGLVRSGTLYCDMDTVAWALQAVGLDGQEQRAARALSGGEAQRLALARVLASGREVLLLDEPTANVDQASASLIERSLCQIRKQRTILFATHDRMLAERLADRIIVCGEELKLMERRKQSAYELAPR
ncbi:MAG: energy-coupling factor ABC transporter ATP-binding protein [Spirochaetaceae bacterium]|nr:energy-coupling factor ABC transporter ATP-binding protein [Spirochaetaceae bacterium]